MILAPMVRGRKGTHKDVFARIRRCGLVRVRVDGLVCELDSVPPLKPQKNHHIDAVVDRVILREEIEDRLTDSVRTAVDYGEGLMMICYQLPQEEGQDENPWQDEFFSTRYACPDCNISYEEFEPRTFSFNSPYGACPVCEGLGLCEQFDPSLVIPDDDLSIEEGAIAAWKGVSTKVNTQNRKALAGFLTKCKADQNTKLSELKPDQRQKLIDGDNKEFPGILVLLEKEFATISARNRLTQLARFRAKVTCHACDGSRLRPEANSVRLQGKTIAEITAQSIQEAVDFFATLKFRGEMAKVANPTRLGHSIAIEVLDASGCRIPHVASIGRHPFRWRISTRAIGDQHRFGIGWDLLHPGRTFDRIASARQRTADSLTA